MAHNLAALFLLHDTHILYIYSQCMDFMKIFYVRMYREINPTVAYTGIIRKKYLFQLWKQF